MSLFDIAAGLVLLVSALVGWTRGGTREVSSLVAFVLAAILTLGALRFTGPVARHAIHTAWLANVAALLVVFAAAYILLRVIAAAVTRSLHQSKALSGADRTLGVGFGVVRALVILGLASLTINAVTPPERMPAWISDAVLWPALEVSGVALKTFAPSGARLARQVAPVVGRAITDKGEAGAPENRAYNRTLEDSPPAPVETTR